MAIPPTSPPVLTGTRSLKMPTFSGGTEKDDLSPLDFVERIETYCKSAKRDPNDECTEMHLALRGNATIWWRTLKRRGINTTLWKEVRKAFLETYAPTITGQTAHAIGQFEQRTGETVNDYFGRLDQIIDEIVVSFPATAIKCQTTYEDLRNHFQKYLFIGGLKETTRMEVLKASPSDLSSSLNEACKSELIYKKQNSRVFAIEENSDETTELDLDEEEIAAINQRRARMGRKPLVRRKFNPAEMKCYNCNRMGHIAKNCTAPRRKPIRSIQEDQREEDDQTPSDDRNIHAIHDDQNLDFW